MLRMIFDPGSALIDNHIKLPKQKRKLHEMQILSWRARNSEN